MSDMDFIGLTGKEKLVLDRSRSAIRLLETMVITSAILLAVVKLSSDHVKVMELKTKVCMDKASCNPKFTLDN